MVIKVGDKVRSDTGKEGVVVMVYRDESAAMVRLQHDDPNATLLAQSLDSLTRIEAFTPPA